MHEIEIQKTTFTFNDAGPYLEITFRRGGSILVAGNDAIDALFEWFEQRVIEMRDSVSLPGSP